MQCETSDVRRVKNNKMVFFFKVAVKITSAVSGLNRKRTVKNPDRELSQIPG